MRSEARRWQRAGSSDRVRSGARPCSLRWAQTYNRAVTEGAPCRVRDAGAAEGGPMWTAARTPRSLSVALATFLVAMPATVLATIGAPAAADIGTRRGAAAVDGAHSRPASITTPAPIAENDQPEDSGDERQHET